MRTIQANVARLWLVLGVTGPCALTLAVVWGLSPRPRFSWAGRLPARYVFRASGEAGLLFAAQTGQPSWRTWIYDSPDGYQETVWDLRAAFPQAQVRNRGDRTELLLAGERGPDLSVARGEGGKATVCARSEKIAPGPFASILARVVPRREPDVEFAP